MGLNSQIKIMPEELASQIAAGEVVERPASVVKELMENALDASATDIEVDVSLKRRRIRVKDNGIGIPSSQLSDAMARHGTSKVYTRDDIFGIQTFGFRGEALPSIASVSRLTLTSRARNEKESSCMEVEGGITLSHGAGPAIDGTEVVVENLFYNTPARRKFIRSDSTEMSHITSTVIQCALSYPGKRFSFTRDKKRVLELPPAKELKERVRQIFGAEYAERTVEVNHQEGLIQLRGLAGRPDFNRATAIDQYFFVNARPVKDALIRGAVARAYEDLTPKGRRPVVFLDIVLPFDLVDVNVHPTKAEVRFSDPGSVRSIVIAGIRRALSAFAVSSLDAVSAGASFYPSQERSSFGGWQPSAVPRNAEGFDRSFELWTNPMREQAEPPAGRTLFDPVHGVVSASAVPVGQLFKTFLVLEDGDRALILDQHTVHERVLFEKIMKRLSEKPMERQRLLMPETVTTDLSRAELLRTYRDTLEKLGWTLEDYGDSAFIIREVPSLLAGKDYPSLLLELAETIDGNRDTDFKQMFNELVSRMACRAAVKAGDELSLKEIYPLVEALGRAELPYTCPHGRPVAMEINKDDISRSFLRPR